MSSSLPLLAGALVLGYFLGSVPFGPVLARLAGAGDLRNVGSGNIGATNVLRTGRKGLAAATLIGDALKGTAAVLIAGLWGTESALAAGLGAFVGHLAPVWLGFRGGKGVATYLGLLLGLAWPAALGFAALWLGTALAFRYSSLAALVAVTATPGILMLLGAWPVAWLFIVLTALAYVTHRGNIIRLWRGEESRINFRTPAS